jgi:hypothetical protein
MGYYFLTNNYIPKDTTSKTKIIWIGEHAINTAFSISTYLENYSSIDHHFILFNRLDNLSNYPFILSKCTILTEEYPLWDDDYSLEKLKEFLSIWLMEESSPIDTNKTVIGNPCELLVQAFIGAYFSGISTLGYQDQAFLEYQSKPKQASLMILQSEVSFKDIKIEVDDLNRLIKDQFKFNIDLQGDTFDWVNYFDTLNESNLNALKSRSSEFNILFNKRKTYE